MFVAAKNGKRPDITLVIPFYNEERILSGTINKAMHYLSTTFSRYELILVDDGSRDSSLRIAKERKSDEVRALSHRPNRGKGYAVRKGILAAQGRTVFFSDADLPYGLEALKKGYDILNDNQCDVVIGSRNLFSDGYTDYPLARQIASRSFILLTNVILNLGVSDIQCGFKGFSQNAAQKIFSHARIDGFTFDSEVLYLARHLGFRIHEIPVKTHNSSKSTVQLWRDPFLMLWDLMKIRSAS